MTEISPHERMSSMAEAVNGLIDAMARDDRPVNQNMAPVRAGEQWDLFK